MSRKKGILIGGIIGLATLVGGGKILYEQPRNTQIIKIEKYTPAFLISGNNSVKMEILFTDEYLVKEYRDGRRTLPSIYCGNCVLVDENSDNIVDYKECWNSDFEKYVSPNRADVDSREIEFARKILEEYAGGQK